ncbi:MAG: glycosyltransferase family 2 protein [Oscillospiraceae bacterium]|nr:glycosyltransferase family 2 protein [Oscillospiraceae bacterium]
MTLSAARKEKLYENYRKNTSTINKNEVKKLNRLFTPVGKIALILFIVICFLAIWRFTQRTEQWYFLGGMMLAYLVVKQFFALLYRPCKRELTKEYKVTAIITCFNENPTSVVSIFENILALDYPVQEILFLDDGSADTLAFEVAKSFAEDHQSNPGAPKFQIIRFEENRGKREVLIDGFKIASGDHVFLLDSDSEILPNALTELLRPFEYGKTTSCVGNIGILNKNKNFLTKLQSISYFGAFQLGRAAQSVTGNVAICSGAFSIHKKDFILQNLDKFKRTSLFGIHVSSGDDRELTALSKIAGGKTRYQSTAYCETEAPENWRKFQSQRRRWQRSAYIGSLASIKEALPKKSIGFVFWAFAEAYFWLIALIIFALSAMMNGFNMDIVDVVIYFAIITYKQNGFYLLYNPVRFLFAPFYFFVYGFSLAYTRIHAALTITDDGWGTRGGVKRQKEQAVPAGEQVQQGLVPACAARSGDSASNLLNDIDAA